ncbi:MAG TPA: condensation domain-containing protein, partial [Steroidobacteraceae bacterium]|nr:condensation domain-containing protein [Steroidobacteraceae bacterium]
AVAQIVDPIPRFSFATCSLENLDEPSADLEVARLIDIEAGAQLDLFEGPLVTCKLIRLPGTRSAVVINIHHIVADHLSMEVFRDELLRACFDEESGQQNSPQPLQYSDFVLWQREFLKGPEAKRQIEYWRTALRDLPPQKLHSKESTSEASNLGGWEEWRVAAPIFEALRSRSAALDVSMFTLILGAVQQLMNIETGQQDIAIATPVSTRFHPDMEKVVGLLLNTLIMRIDQPSSTRKSDFIQHVRGVVLSALENKDVPAEVIQKALGATSDQRLFGVRYVYRRIRAKKDERDRATRITTLDVPGKDAKFDLLISFNEYDDALVGDLEYRAELWSESAIARMKTNLQTILKWLSATGDETLSNLHRRLVTSSGPIMNDSQGTREVPVIHAPDRRQEIAQFVRADAGRIRALLQEQGGVLLRGFRISGAAHLERLIREGFEGTPLTYENRSTPRSAVAGKIYTSTEYPANQTIPMHNENSYTRSWPGKIFFYCVQPSPVGGETPVADSRRVLSRLPRDLVQRFDRHGVLYVRNYQDLDLSWKEVFQTERREDVERYCRDNDMEFEWFGEDHLRTRQRCQAIVRHPVTNEAVWFNQAHLFHVSALPKDVREALQASVAECDLPRNAFLGDGSPIHADDLAAIRNAYEEEKQVFRWQAGDILCLDNLLMAHGRNPYEGSRKVLVGMSESFVNASVGRGFAD